MLYTASYFEPQRHHGKLISISRSIPQNFRINSRLEFFIPSADLLRDWKAKRPFCHRNLAIKLVEKFRPLFLDSC